MSTPTIHHDDATGTGDWFGPGRATPSGPSTVTRVHRPAGVLRPASWAEALYAVIDLAPAITFFVLSVTLISVGLGLTIIYVGLPLLALALLIARAGGHLQRILAAVLLDLPVSPPAPIRRRKPGPIGALTSILLDPGCWRAVTYHGIKILLAPVTFSFAIAFYATGLGGVTYGLWQHYLPLETAADGSRHRGMQWWNGYYVDTWPRMLLLAVVGALFLAGRAACSAVLHHPSIAC